MNYLSIGGKPVITNDQSKLTRWDVIVYDMEVAEKPFKKSCYKIVFYKCELDCAPQLGPNCWGRE